MRKLNFFLLGLVLLFLPLAHSFSESSYTITESQMQELKAILSDYQTLQTNYQTLQKNYQEITTDFQTSSERLKKQSMTDKVKVGSISFGVGATAGILTGALIYACLKK